MIFNYLTRGLKILRFGLYCTASCGSIQLNNSNSPPGTNVFYHLAFAAMTLMYLTYTWGNHVHQQGKRKNPADFENDE